MINSELLKPYMLLRDLPLHSKCDIREKRFWMNAIGIDSEIFDTLIKKGWFK